MSDTAKKTVTKAAAPKENGSAGVEQRQKVTVGVDRNNEQVLQLNIDTGVQLVWDPKDFRKLPNAVVDQLSRENLKAYLKAEGAAEALKPQGKVEVMRNPLLSNPLSGYAESREFIRARRGWHQYWANPGRDFDERMRGPYRQVRVPTDEQKKAGYEPGEENGEVLKRLDGEGKVEAIALECPQDQYEAYLQWMADASGLAKTTVKRNFAKRVEEINRDLPADMRVGLVDDEGDL